MNSILMAALCAGAGLGLLLVIQGLRGRRILPDLNTVFPDGTTLATATAWTAAAFVVGLMVLAVTRWVGAAIGVGALVMGVPWFFGGTKQTRREIERTQAIATWAIDTPRASATALTACTIASSDGSL